MSERDPRNAAIAPRWLGPAFGVASVLLLVALLASPGSGSPFGAFATVLILWAEAGTVAGAWLLGALGIGGAVAAALRAPESVGSALGVAVMLWLAHAMGALGLFGSGIGTAFAWAPCAVGIVLLLVRLRRSDANLGTVERILPVTALLAAPAVALLAVGACLPPGTVWASEAHGFDTLSYHLQLPTEWLAAGRIAPLEHNAYSWLPSGMESAFTQLGAMLGGGNDAIAGGQGLGIHGAQMLHALLTLCAAVVTGRTAHLLIAGGPSDRDRFNLAGIVGSIAVSVPWVIVVGSSAYNEGAVLLMLAGALRAAIDDRLSPALRGAVCGVLMGAATAAKPTAFFMGAIPLGVVLVSVVPVRRWPSMLALGCAAGVCMLAPWLLRNGIAGGNPVFPYLTGLFGSAHWTEPEIERWRIGHHEGATVAERFALLFSVDRGVLHPQWALFPLIVLASVPLALRERGTRRIGLALVGAVLVQVVCWLSIGHLQARFLLPLVAPGALLIALALGALRAWRPRAAVAAGVVLTVALSLASVRVFLAENAGAPNLALIPGVPALTGEALLRAMPSLTPAERQAQLEDAPPAVYINLTLPDSTVYLLGDSTPLYLRPGVLYHTTWDPSPLGEALDQSSGDLRGALRRLRERGVTHVLVNLDEYARLSGDGWYDPRVTPEIVHRVVTEGGRPLRSWGTSGALGTYLIELPDSGDGGAP